MKFRVNDGRMSGGRISKVIWTVLEHGWLREEEVCESCFREIDHPLGDRPYYWLEV
jgi:hypothetical protein